MSRLKDYVLFKKFIMPAALQFLFWAGVAGTLYGTWWLYSNGNWAWILSLVFGLLITRLVFEGFILRYQTYILLTQIKQRLGEQ